MVKLYKVYLVDCNEYNETLHRINLIANDAEHAEEKCYLEEIPICEKGEKCKCFYKAELDLITSPLGILAEIQSRREELISMLTRIKISGIDATEYTTETVNRKTAELDELTRVYVDLGGEY